MDLLKRRPFRRHCVPKLAFRVFEPQSLRRHIPMRPHDGIAAAEVFSPRAEARTRRPTQRCRDLPSEVDAAQGPSFSALPGAVFTTLARTLPLAESIAE